MPSAPSCGCAPPLAPHAAIHPPLPPPNLLCHVYNRAAELHPPILAGSAIICPRGLGFLTSLGCISWEVAGCRRPSTPAGLPLCIEPHLPLCYQRPVRSGCSVLPHSSVLRRRVQAQPAVRASAPPPTSLSLFKPRKFRPLGRFPCKFLSNPKGAVKRRSQMKLTRLAWWKRWQRPSCAAAAGLK